ncbi:hypothetical protein LLE49_26290 [Alicyclobacillus tolerans]|uniref:hypothetical protein n=1 Tax=Alicyclobacillus tolerans TaxID=90970 RepID=UPI001F2181E7|nr:hypothetical protein [Alicyclobacillus tolerans]MCF8568236.1 hypothetical protein [Alicyclobacillus tolerans]
MEREEAARVRADEWLHTSGRQWCVVEYQTVSFPKKHERFWWEFGRDVLGLMDERAGVGNDDVNDEDELKRFGGLKTIRFIERMEKFLLDIVYFFSHTLPVDIDESEWEKHQPWTRGTRRKVTYAEAIWLLPMLEWYHEWCMDTGRAEMAEIAQHYVDELERPEERAFLQAVFDLIQEQPMLWSN